MSGIETIGIVASASQLAAYSIKIVSCLSQIYKEVSGLPHQIKDHVKQIEKLIETTILIQQHKSLHSPQIFSQLQTTLKEAISLCNVLTETASRYAEHSFRGYWAFWKSGGEKEILNRLSKLEREKSALRLCISLIHTDILLNIQSSLDSATNHRMSTPNGYPRVSNNQSSPDNPTSPSSLPIPGSFPSQGNRTISSNNSVSHNHLEST